MAVAVDAQTALDERVLDNAELADALEKRHEAKSKESDARMTAKLLDDRVKMLIAAEELEDGAVVRCGDYRIEKRSVAARSVSFDTEPTSRLSIRPVE